MLLGDYAQQKQVGWEVIFSEHGFAGSGVHKPRQELVGSALHFFLQLDLRLQGASIVGKVPLKSQCKKYGIWRGKSNHTLARCVFFYQHCFPKIIET